MKELKHYTNAEQTKRLLKLLKSDTTDFGSAFDLVDLIELMPMMIIKNNNAYMLRMGKGSDKIGHLYTFFYQHQKTDDIRLFETAAHNNIVDAAVEMLEWMNEHKDTFDYVQ